MSSGLLYDHDDVVVQYLADKIPGCERGFGPCRAVGVVRQGHFVGGYVYHNWCPETGVIEISAASEGPHWMTRDVMNGMFGAPFKRMGAQMVVMRVAETNQNLRALLRRLGCREVLIPRLRGRYEAEAILTLTDDDWFASPYFKG